MCTSDKCLPLNDEDFCAALCLQICICKFYCGGIGVGEHLWRSFLFKARSIEQVAQAHFWLECE